MKSCPTCNRTFEDSFTFCLMDGAVLSAPFDPQATQRIPEVPTTDPPPTEVLPDKISLLPTALASKSEASESKDIIQSTIATPNASPETPAPLSTPLTPPGRKSNKVLIIISGIVALMIASAIMFIVASRNASNSSNSATTNIATTARTNSSVTTSNSAARASTTSSGAQIGVPECDDYLVKYEACISDKVPEAARAQFKSNLELRRKMWRDLAANPQTKPGLAQTCKNSTDAARLSMSAYGCDF